MTARADFVPAAVAGRPVFTAAGRTFAWSEVASAAEARGLWQPAKDAASSGLALRQEFLNRGEQDDDAALVAALTRFRYAHNLIAGDDLVAWLDHWGLNARDWRESLRAGLVRESHAAEPAAAIDPEPGEDHNLAEAAWTEAVCSGLAATVASDFAAGIALWLQAGGALQGDPLPYARIEDSARQLREAAATEDALLKEVSNHRLEWLRLEGTRLDLPDADIAREAVMCVRVDGRLLSAVAADCGVAPLAFAMTIAEADEEIASGMLGAREGDLLGPVQRDGRFTLFQVERRAAPSLDDSAVRELARAAVLARVTEHAMRQYVTWHESF